MIQELPPEYRIILVLRAMEGLTAEEVGNITGLQPGNARKKLTNGLIFLPVRQSFINSSIGHNRTPFLNREGRLGDSARLGRPCTLKSGGVDRWGRVGTRDQSA